MQFHPLEIKTHKRSVLTGWCTKEGHQSVLFFTHGNGFCGRVYQPMHELLAQRYDLLMLDIPGHGDSPASEFVGWNQTAEHLWQAIQTSGEIINNRELHAVGHSLGGMLSMLMASEHPDTFKSMVLLDPIIFPRPLLLLMRALSGLGLTSTFHPFVKPTLRRRNGWSDRQEAFDYFYNRKIFKNWTDDSLHSYVRYALKETGTQLRLSCEPELEAKWFSSLPDNLWPSIKKLSTPVKVVMGQSSYPFSLRAARYAAQINSSIEYSTVPGGHCFMQECPQDTADYVLKAL